MRKIILASASPRRKELLEKIGLKFRAIPSKFDEKLNPRLQPKTQAEVLSIGKAQIVAKKCDDAIIIATNTFVVFQNQIIGKPESIEDAKRILKKLSGNVHTVITGFTILDTATKKTITDSVETKVFMREISDKEINAFIKKENTLDKAGAYNIDGLATIFIEKIDGNYDNVMGLPICNVIRALKKLNVLVI